MMTKRSLVLVAVAMCASLLVTGARGLSAADEFLRGDANTDGQLSISDAITIKLFLFQGGAVPSCMDSADINDDGNIDISDEIEVLFEFLPNRAWNDVIVAPFPEAGVDPTEDDLGCEGYELDPPESTDDLVRLGDVTAAPGEEVEIPVFVSSSVDLDAVQIVVDYDPAVFTPGSKINYDGTFFGAPPNAGRGFTALKAWPSSGVFTIAIIGDVAGGDQRIPAGEEILIAKVPGTIAADVEPGSELTLEARTDGFGEYGLRTELTHLGESRFISAFPRVQGALLQIVGDLTFFRGDANGDEEVNVSDSQFILNYLFVGGSTTPGCLDAADANDDGRVDIADAITLLSFLFGGANALPPPYPDRGVDSTGDSLSCIGAGS